MKWPDKCGNCPSQERRRYAVTSELKRLDEMGEREKANVKKLLIAYRVADERDFWEDLR